MARNIPPSPAQVPLSRLRSRLGEGEVTAASGLVLFLPGNGHASMRLEEAREALGSRGLPRQNTTGASGPPRATASVRAGAPAGGPAGVPPVELVELSYGPASSYEALLDDLERQVQQALPADLVYATGIGGLVALSLRARGALRDVPVVLQGAVLWGLEQRSFPRLMRVPGMPWALAFALKNELVQRRFVRRHLRSKRDAAWRRRFFAGYGDARAFADWFAWLRPELLRRLEQELEPEQLAGCEAWWGEHDTVVGLEELRVTEAALGVSLALRRFPEWGHYPMIDDPKGWAEEVRRAVALARDAS